MPQSLKGARTLAPRFYAIMSGLALGGLIQVSQNERGFILPLSAPQMAIGNSSAFQVLASMHTAHKVAPPSIRRGSLADNETLSELFKRLGASPVDSSAALAALSPHMDMRRLPRGLPVALGMTNKQTLNGISLYPEAGRQILALPSHAGGWKAHKLQARLSPQQNLIQGQIKSSIYSFIKQQGGSDQQVMDFADIFSYDLDFQRQVQSGDQLEILYQKLTDERGNPVRTGHILYASLKGRNLSRAYYRFSPQKGMAAYYDENGLSPHKFLMKTPLNGARLSSHFGPRHHPVLGYDKMHKGVDFAARTGTPVFAAGDGIVEYAGRKGSYGKYIRLLHANDYETAYAHLQRLAPSTKQGQRVSQGDIIGYVGSTGRSTGPHLHYEVIHNGKHVNPMKLELAATGIPLKNTEKPAFLSAKARIDEWRRDLSLQENSQATIMLLDSRPARRYRNNPAP